MNESNDTAREGGPPQGAPPFSFRRSQNRRDGKPTKMKDTLGSRLRAARDAKGWTLDELATQSGVSKAMLSRVESGERSLTLDTAVALCDALGLSLDELAGRKMTTGKTRHASVAKAKRLAEELTEQLERLLH